MSIDWWTLGLQAVNVLVLLFILSRFLFRPVVAMMAERQAAATRDLDAARAARAAAEAEQAKAVAETAALAAARKEKLDAATAAAETRKAGLLEEARAEAEALRTAAQADIARARAAAAREEADQASRLSVEIAGRLLARLPAGAQVAPFIEDLATAVAALPEASRASLSAEPGPLRLKAARALSGREVKACQDRLAAVLGHAVTLAVEVDPALIAGLELSAPHAVVRNSFRDDLDRILKELTRHD